MDWYLSICVCNVGLFVEFDFWGDVFIGCICGEMLEEWVGLGCEVFCFNFILFWFVIDF